MKKTFKKQIAIPIQPNASLLRPPYSSSLPSHHALHLSTTGESVYDVF